MIEKLKIIPAYTEYKTLEEALKNERGRKLLWLEILLNDSIDWSKKLKSTVIKKAFNKACLWYSHFSNSIAAHIHRKPLETRSGKIDFREYRKFLEALTYVGS